MTMDDARAQLAHYARRLVADGLVVGTAGNLSVRVDDLVVVTPSAVPYEQMDEQSMCVLDLDGHQVDGSLPASTEVPMHLAVYRGTDARAVVHTHSPYATALSTVLGALPAVHYAMAGLGGTVRVVPYATFGSAELARKMLAGLSDRSAVILQNHGTITYGRDLAQAYQRSITLEWLAATYHRARLIADPKILTDEELDAVRIAGRTKGFRAIEAAAVVVPPPAAQAL